MLTRLPPPKITKNLNLINADRITWELGDSLDREYRNEIFDHYPNAIANVMANIYKDEFKNNGRRDANYWLLKVDEGVNKGLIDIALSEDAISQLAELKARKCQRLRMLFKSLKSIYEEQAKEVIKFGLKPPVITDKVTHMSASKRMTCKQWWRRQMRKMSAREFESQAIRLGMVHSKKSIYVSDAIYGRYLDQARRNIETLSKLEMVNEEDETIDLIELLEHSLANPAIRRGELMTRIAGFDKVALDSGHDGLFLTITCPSRYHARMSKSGDKNPNYAGFNPRQSQDYLNRQFARVRAQLSREGIRFYGFRVVEPHHDGTPHWHLLIFVEKENTLKLTEIFRHYALEESPNERGAQKRRFVVEHIDRKKGSAAAYIAKYISKSIDGYGVDVDNYGKDAKQSAPKIVVWAKTFGIRQFQQIGGPPIGIWRELRRLKERPSGNLGKAFDYADIGDWAGFVNVMGGPFANRSDRTIKLAKLSATDQLTGEIRLNQYMEPASDQVYGVEEGGQSVCTRTHEWRIQSKPIGQDTGQSLGQPEMVNLGDLTYRSGHGQDGTPKGGDLTYRSKSGRYVTLREKDSLRNVNITGNFENSVHVNEFPLEFCQ